MICFPSPVTASTSSMTATSVAANNFPKGSAAAGIAARAERMN